MKIVLIHGAWSSTKVFNYLTRELLPLECVVLDYHTSGRFEDTLDMLYEQVSCYQEVFFVGHSLGGMYSLHLADKLQERCVGGVTIATPYGGIPSSYLLSFMFPTEPILKDLSSTSYTIRQNHRAWRPSNWTQVVCRSGGSPWIRGENDGVVPVSSQCSIEQMDKVLFECGHHEVLQDPALVELVKEKVGVQNVASL